MESDASYFGAELATAIAATLSVPPAVGRVRDIEMWRRLTACYLLADANLRLISVWSPTFLLALLEFLKTHADAVLGRLSPRRRREAARLLRVARDQMHTRHPLDGDACYILGRMSQDNKDWKIANSFYEVVVVNHPDSRLAPLAKTRRTSRR